MIGREDKNGPQGDGINIDKSFTLNTIDRHAIAVRTAQTGANGIGVADEKAHTLDGANGQAVCYENHANDSRVTRCEDGIVPTLSSRMGTGGGNVPFVLTPLLK